MQESVEKKREKLKPYKHKVVAKPIIKLIKPPGEKRLVPKIHVTVRPKEKSSFIAPKTINPPEIENKPKPPPVIGSKPSADKTALEEQEIKSISTVIKVKKESKERLKGSIEELILEPQKLKALSSEIEEPEETRVKTNFDSSIPPIGREIKELLEVPEIKSINFTPSTIKIDFDASLPEFKERVVTIPKLSVTKPQEVIMRNYFDKEVSTQVISKIKELILEVEEKVEEETQVTNVIDELFLSLKGGSCLKWKLNRPLCIILTGDKPDGMRTIEDLMSTKYTFLGFYDFSKNLPWQDVLKSVKEKIKTHKSETREREDDIYNKIISEDLIISDVISVIDKDKIIKGLRDISNRGAKCLIFYTQNVEDFENLDSEVYNVDMKIIRLPKLDDKVKKLISKLTGVDLEVLDDSIDSLWHRAVRVYEEEAEELDRKLPSKDVDYFPERETETHYLMKKLLYHYLKNKKDYKDKEIKVEEPIILDGEGELKKIIPDIIIKGDEKILECWEVETGYPSKDEEEWIKEPFSPYARFVWKLKKYGEGGYKKVNVVLPSIYGHMFKEDVRKVKGYFEEKIELKFYTLHWYKKAGIRFFR